MKKLSLLSKFNVDKSMKPDTRPNNYNDFSALDLKNDFEWLFFYLDLKNDFV